MRQRLAAGRKPPGLCEIGQDSGNLLDDTNLSRCQLSWHCTTPQGCIAQAWTVAEVLRAWLATENR